MTKRLHHSSSSSESEISLLEDNEFDLSSSSIRLPCRTKHSGRYQSDIYTGLISANRTYSNGKIFTRLEQLITINHDDQIRSLLLILRHYSMKHEWNHILYYLKSLLQSSFVRSYIRLYWQLIFRYLIENFYTNNRIDLDFLTEVFEKFIPFTNNKSYTNILFISLFIFN